MTGSSTATTVAASARLFMLAAAVFVAAAGVSLFFLSERTNQFFAWTIKPPITAAFIGGGYLAVTTALALALRENDWARVRVGVWVVATGLISILVATLLHLDKFHLHSPIWSAKAWAWSWLVLYIALVPGLLAALWAQRHKTATEPPRRATLPPALRLALRLLAAMMLIVGAALFVAPGTAEQVWPWTLTPLTARMVGSFYLAFAVSLFAAARENDYARIHVASYAYVVFAALQVVTAVRYPAVSWRELPGLLLAGVLLALFAIGVMGVRGYLTSRSVNN
jgi:hypothetical protein